MAGRTVEQLVEINCRRAEALQRAQKYPSVGTRGASGVKRDRAIAKAHREYYSALAKIGIRTRRRWNKTRRNAS
jgi:hypothetical protein